MEENKGGWWSKVEQFSGEIMKRYRTNQEALLSILAFERYKADVEENIERSQRLALTNEAKSR